MNVPKNSPYRAFSFVLISAAIIIPFKESVGQIFLFLAALLAPFTTADTAHSEEGTNENTPAQKTSDPSNFKTMVLLVLGLIVAGTVSTYIATGKIKPGPAIGMWKYPLALTLLLGNTTLLARQKAQTLKALLTSLVSTGILIFVSAPRFWTRRYTDFFGIFSGGSANVFPSIWAIVVVVLLSLAALRRTTSPTEHSEKAPAFCWWADIMKMKYLMPLTLFAIFAIGAGRSRAALGIFLAGIVLIALSKASWKLIAGSVVALALLFGLVPRFREIPQGKENSFYYRYITCTTAVDIFKEQPLFGCGPKNYRENFMRIYGKTLLGFKPRCANNFYFSILAEQGLVGIVLFFAWLFLLVRELLARRKNSNWNTAVLIAFIAYLAGGMVLDNKFLAHQSGMVMVFLITLTAADRKSPDAVQQ